MLPTETLRKFLQLPSLQFFALSFTELKESFENFELSYFVIESSETFKEPPKSMSRRGGTIPRESNCGGPAASLSQRNFSRNVRCSDL